MVAERRSAGRVAQPLRLWEALFDGAEGWLELRALTPATRRLERAWFPIRPAALRAAAGWAVSRRRAHVWFGINPRGRRGGGGAQDVASVVAFAVDLDAKRLGPTKSDALTPLRRFPLPPTCLVDSGHGWQAYWALKKPWIREGDEDRREALLLSRRLTLTLGGDATFDLARVLRVPGTWNVKGEPVPCRLVASVRRRRYDPLETDPYLRELPAGLVPAGPEVTFKDVAPPAPERLQIPAWARRLIERGDVAHRYRSRSEADMAVVQALVRAEVGPDAIRALYRTHAIGARYREKGSHGDDYLARTIVRAQLWAREEGERHGGAASSMPAAR